MPQFDPVTWPSQIFWLVVTFLLLYFLMTRLVLPRIGQVLDERAARIAANLDRAERLRREAEGVMKAYEAAMAAAREQATARIAEVTRELGERAAAREAEFGAGLAQRVAEAEARIARARDEAAAQIRSIAADVAADVAAKLVGARPSEAAATAAVDRVLAGAARPEGGR